MKKYIKLVDIVVIIVVIACSLLVTSLLAYDNAQYAVVYVDGREFGRYSINNDDRQSIDVSTEYGYNLVIIDKQKVWVAESDCKDKVEVSAGSIDKSGQSLICLPNRLVVTIEGSIHTDATAF